MGIDLLWRDSRGGIRDVVYDTSGTLSALVNETRSYEQNRHMLISAIDPYGDTRFSSTHAVQLLREFEALRRQLNPDDRIIIGHFMSVIRAVEGSADDWLEFVGD